MQSKGKADGCPGRLFCAGFPHVGTTPTPNFLTDSPPPFFFLQAPLSLLNLTLAIPSRPQTGIETKKSLRPFLVCQTPNHQPSSLPGHRLCEPVRAQVHLLIRGLSIAGGHPSVCLLPFSPAVVISSLSSLKAKTPQLGRLPRSLSPPNLSLHDIERIHCHCHCPIIRKALRVPLFEYEPRDQTAPAAPRIVLAPSSLPCLRLHPPAARVYTNGRRRRLEPCTRHDTFPIHPSRQQPPPSNNSQPSRCPRMESPARRPSFGDMLLRRSKSGDVGKKAQAARDAELARQRQRPPRLPEFANNAGGQLSNSLSSQLNLDDSPPLNTGRVESTGSFSNNYTYAPSTASPPTSSAPFDPYARTESMTHRGRYSYASSAISTLNSPRRVRRRKDPTPFK